MYCVYIDKIEGMYPNTLSIQGKNLEPVSINQPHILQLVTSGFMKEEMSLLDHVALTRRYD